MNPSQEQPSPIQAVLFDVGGVLFRFKDVTPYREWEQRLNLSEGELAKIVFSNPISRRAMVGQSTPEEVWAEVQKQLALSMADLELLQLDIWKGGAWDTELLEFIRSLRPAYKTGIISDAWTDARAAIQAFVNESLFDVIIFSAEEKLRKPEPEIYLRALTRLKLSPEEAIFVDDMPYNVEAARQLGMQAILFTDSAAVIQAIRQLIGRE
jgi:putative hydrolase of the HAD superfamily